MSRAFVKEDVDPPERSARVKAASGLPPGALNYMTASGSRRLRARLADLCLNGDKNAAEITRLESALDSAVVVNVPVEAPGTVAFGTLVTIRDASGTLHTFHIVGVDEFELEEDGVSWISPLGKTLLGAEVGDRVSIGEKQGKATIEKIEYPNAAD